MRMTPKVPLTSLRAFDAVVRTGGVGAAARHLGVTQSAVSQQLRTLEASLGVPLLVRDGRSIRPTEAGERLGARLGSAFEEIDAALADVVRSDAALTVSLPPTFAIRWLIPRLSDFQARHPLVAIRLVTTAAFADFRRDGIDCAIRYGTGRWPGLHSELLMRGDIFPVAAPAMAKRLARTSDLARVPWLIVDSAPRPADWPTWLSAAKADGMAPPSTMHFANSGEAIAAAVAGLGVAMAHRPFAEDDLAAGRLIAPFKVTAQASDAYWLVCPPATEARSSFQAFRVFRAWLLKAVNGSAGS